MRNYEIVFVFKDDEEAYKKGKELAKKELDRIEAVITKEDDMGSRELAYMVKKENRGHYHIYFIDADPEKVPSLERPFRMDSDILKFLIIRCDD